MVTKAEVFEGVKRICPDCVIHEGADYLRVVDEKLQLFFRGSLEESTIWLHKTQLPINQAYDFRKEVERLETVAYFLEKFKGHTFDA
jgi:hypothetical protein